MSGRQPRQVQRKLGEADADGNWQLGSPAPVSATDDKTQSVAGYKRRAPTAAAGPYSASNLQAAIHHNAAKETEEAVKAKPVDQGERRATRRLDAAGRRRRARAARREEAAAVLRRLPRRQEEATGVWQGRPAHGAGGEARAQGGGADGERSQS